MQRRNSPPRSVRTAPSTPSDPYRVPGAAGAAAQRFQMRQARRRLTRLALFVAAALVLAMAVYTVAQIPKSEARPVMLGCSPNDPVQAFGQYFLYYNNGMLSCSSVKGGIRWQFSLGTGASFHTDGSTVAAWNGRQLYILDGSGTVTYNDRVDGDILFARAGTTYVLAAVRSEDGLQVRVTDHTGVLAEQITLEDVTLLDAGFFGSKLQRMYTLTLDARGDTPATQLNTYEPGRLATGAVTVTGQIIYSVYASEPYLMAAGTVRLTAYDYKCTVAAAIPEVLVYGYQLLDTRALVGEAAALYAPPPDSAGQWAIRRMRLIGKTTDVMLYLPAICTDAVLTTRGVVAFSGRAAYWLKYGQTRFETATMAVAVDRVLCVLDSGYAAVADGLSAYVVKLPGY